MECRSSLIDAYSEFFVHSYCTLPERSVIFQPILYTVWKYLPCCFTIVHECISVRFVFKCVLLLSVFFSLKPNIHCHICTMKGATVALQSYGHDKQCASRWYATILLYLTPQLWWFLRLSYIDWSVCLKVLAISWISSNLGMCVAALWPQGVPLVLERHSVHRCVFLQCTGWSN